MQDCAASLKSWRESLHCICTYSKDCLTFPVPGYYSPVSLHHHFFFHRWIFCSINPTDQVGFVNVLNFNTLGHLSLRSNPGPVSHQTSYFLIWFGREVAQEREQRGSEGWWWRWRWWWWWSGAEWSGLERGFLLNEILMWAGRGRLGRGVIMEVEAPHQLKKVTPLWRRGFTWSFMFFLFWGAPRCAAH